MKTAEKPNAPWLARLLFRLPHSLFRALLLRGSTAAAYGSAAPADAVARDRQVLAKEQFTMQGVAAQAAAIGAYVTTRGAVARSRRQCQIRPRIRRSDP
jgi:hypothetical protein